MSNLHIALTQLAKEVEDDANGYEDGESYDGAVVSLELMGIVRTLRAVVTATREDLIDCPAPGLTDAK